MAATISIPPGFLFFNTRSITLSETASTAYQLYVLSGVITLTLPRSDTVPVGSWLFAVSKEGTGSVTVNAADTLNSTLAGTLALDEAWKGAIFISTSGGWYAMRFSKASV